MKCHRCLVVVCALTGILCLSGCSLSPWIPSLQSAVTQLPTEEPGSKQTGVAQVTARPMYQAGVLLAVVASEKEAQEIAELYGITLESVTEGLAKFTTEKEIQELIDLGKQNGWPTLEPDYLNYFP